MNANRRIAIIATALALLAMPIYAAEPAPYVDHVEFDKYVYFGRKMIEARTVVPLDPSRVHKSTAPTRVLPFGLHLSHDYLGAVTKLTVNPASQSDKRFGYRYQSVDLTIVTEDGKTYQVVDFWFGHHAREESRQLIGRKLIVPYELWIMRSTIMFD